MSIINSALSLAIVATPINGALSVHILSAHVHDEVPRMN